MKSSKITAIHGIGSMVGYPVVDVTLQPDQRFLLAFEDSLAADLVGAIASASAQNLARKARSKQRGDPPTPIECERLGFFLLHSDPEKIVVAATVKDGVVIPLSLPRSAIQSMIENLRALESGTERPSAN